MILLFISKEYYLKNSRRDYDRKYNDTQVFSAEDLSCYKLDTTLKNPLCILYFKK